MDKESLYQGMFPGQNDLNLSREQGYFDKSVSIQLLIIAIFMFSLFTFLHFREIKVEFLEIGSSAERYIVSQVDFQFLDEEVNITAKQEAIRDIETIYRINERQINDAKAQFEKILIKDDWRSKAPDSTFEELNNALKAFEEALLNLRFSQARTLHKRQEVGLSIDDYQVYNPSKNYKKNFLPSTVFKQIVKHALPSERFSEDTSSMLLNFFKDIEWSLEEDHSARAALQRVVEKKVPLAYKQVKAGERLIAQGETVTTRHLAMMQAMKKAMSSSRKLWHPVTLLGSFLITFLITGISLLFLWSFHPPIFFSNKKFFLLVSILLLGLFFSKLVEFLLLHTTSNLSDFVRFPLLLPFPAILLSSLMSSGVASFATAFLAVVQVSTLAFDQQGFLLLNLLSALAAVLNTRPLRKRKEVFIVCIKSWFCAALVIISFHFYEGTYWGGALFADLFTSYLFMLITAVLIVGLLPLLEAAFHIMTDVMLMEYMDPNHQLLRRLAIEAPGTYQHSVVVGNLAEAAASSIGANGLFCRVSTLYHDIGKLTTPHYFTENQQGGVNIHQLLTPIESAEVIISHVSEGVAMARKAGLPEQFIDIIKEHHGTTLVYYFYAKQLELVGGDRSKIDEADFRYSGPKPRRKESTIIMIADSLEAASRSLDEINEESVSELVESIIQTKIEEGQFENSLLSFEELQIVKKALIKTVVAVGHSRIKYPKIKK